jgi:hypothetical protein
MGISGISPWPYLLIVMLAVVVPFWRILGKAGLPSWLSLFALFPPAALLLLYVVAFVPWPSQRLESR